MGDRSRWTHARWRDADNAVWRAEQARFGPLPARISDEQTARDRSLWQAEAYAHIAIQADRARRAAALQARRHGATFEEIGRALGITRQAASKLLTTATSSTAGDGFMIDHKAS